MNDITKGVIVGVMIGVVLMMEYQKIIKPRNKWQRFLAVFRE